MTGGNKNYCEDTLTVKAEGRGAITFELVRNWVPILGSVLALAVAIGAYISDTSTRLTILEVTVERSIEARLENIENRQTELRKDFEDHMERLH